MFADEVEGRTGPAALIARAAAFWAILGGFLLLAVVAVNAASVLGGLFGTSFSGDFELTEMGVAIAVFAFLPYCQLTDANVTAAIFTARASPRVVAGLRALASLVAFGFARFRFPGRDPIFVLLLATMMIPWDVKMIPLYMEFNLLGWINTLKPLIVPAWFGEAFFIFLLRQYIMTVPMEIDEAARMDGANAWQLYWRIHLPLMVPGLVLVA